MKIKMINTKKLFIMKNFFKSRCFGKVSKDDIISTIVMMVPVSKSEI